MIRLLLLGLFYSILTNFLYFFAHDCTYLYPLMAEHFFPSFGGIMSSSWQHFFVGSLQVACSATATRDKIKSVVFLTMDKLFFLPHSTSETHLLRNYHRIKVSCTVYIMAIPVVEFSREGYKIRKVFG